MHGESFNQTLQSSSRKRMSEGVYDCPKNPRNAKIVEVVGVHAVILPSKVLGGWRNF